MSVRRLLRLVVPLAVLSTGAACGDKPNQVAVDASARIQDTADARAFVQRFYAWYAPRRASGEAWAEVLRRDTLFHPILLTLLKEDYALQGNEERPRSTIDGDPFTGQDPCPPFAVQRVEPAGNRFRVTVIEACAQKRILPFVMSLVLEVAYNGKHWEILDVYYGADSISLVGYLCKYALEDRRPESAPRRARLRDAISGGVALAEPSYCARLRGPSRSSG